MKDEALTVPSFSVVVETENLGMAGIEDLEASLNSLKAQTYPIEKANEVLLIVGGHVSEDMQKLLSEKYPWITIHNTGQRLEYTQAKYKGAEVATGEIVVFADSDVRYQDTWLESLLTCFATHPDADIVYGDTMSEPNSVYAMSINLTWMFTILPPITETERSTRFQFNNFAVRRSVMMNTPTTSHFPFYRALKMTQWRKMLNETARATYRVPGALALHNPPGSFLDWWYRMLIQGRDMVAIGDCVTTRDEYMESPSLPRRILMLVKTFRIRFIEFSHNGRNLIRRDRRHAVRIVLSIPLCIVSVSVIMLGCVVSIFNRDYILRKITAHEGHHVV